MIQYDSMKSDLLRKKSGWSQHIELLFAMTEREIKARYKHAVLGFLWIILNPLLQMVVIGSVFSFVIKVPIQNYFLFLFSGLLMWNFFSLTVLKVTPSIVFELSLIEKAHFPREVIILSIVLANLFHTIISFLLFIPLLLFLGKITWWHVIFLPLLFVWMTVLIAGIGLLTSALNVKFRDVSFFVQAIMPLWFYGTPILYTLSMVPEKFRIFFFFNPLTGILEFTRWIMLNGSNALPSVPLICANIFFAIGIFLIGFFVFSREALFFDDWI